MLNRAHNWIIRIALVVAGALGAVLLLPAFSVPQPQEASNQSTDELLKRIDKLLDEKLAKLKEDVSKDVKAQIEGNNKQVLGAALTLQKTLKDSLGEVSSRALSFERSFKVLLMQTSLFDEHGPSIGVHQEPLDDQAREAYGFKRGDATRVAKFIENSSGQAAGLQVGDVVDWRNPEAKQFLPGETREFMIIRRGARLTVSVRLTCKKCNSQLCPFTMKSEMENPSERRKEAAPGDGKR